jgi:hypothetical protein
VHKNPPRSSASLIESLEDRRLLSVAHHAVQAQSAHAKHHAKAAAAITAALKASSTTATTSSIAASATTTSSISSSDSSSTQDFEAQVLDKIQFGQTPSAVQTGLKALVSTDGLTAPTSTDTVYLGNQDGIETYSLVITSAGTTTRLTVDPSGAPVTDPVKSITTWATLNGTGTGSNSAAAAEISKIVTALGLTAPTDTTTVDVLTASDGTATYSIRLAKSSSSGSASTDWQAYDETTVSVNSDGVPVGHEELPFSVLPGAIQDGINNNLPTGATALDATSTQTVDVLTANGKTFFTTSFTTSGTTTKVTVDATGALATLPGTTTADFSTIPAAAQTAIKALATANGVTTAIADTQSVTVYDEGNGTTIYSVSLTATDSTTSSTFTLTISVDQAGNPTVPPNHGHGECGGGGHDDDGSGDSIDGLSGGFGRRRGRAFA